MQKNLLILLFCEFFLLLAIPILPVQAQYNYAEALQKTLYFYEAQRSGAIAGTTRVEWRGNSHLSDGADMGLDLTGGWYDAGDTPKWNTSMAFLGSTLAWSAAEYKNGYVGTGQMPYLLDNLRFVGDYFSKCFTYTDINNPDTYKIVIDIGYANVVPDDGDATTEDGNPADPANSNKAEHSYWAPHEVFHKLVPNRPTYYADKDYPQSGTVAAMAATLASSAFVLWNNGQQTVADQYLDKAEKLYNFAKTHRNTEANKDFYKNKNGNKAKVTGYGSGPDADKLAWAAIWIYRAQKQKDFTTDQTLLNEAATYGLEFKFDVWNATYGMWNYRLAAYMLLQRFLGGTPAGYPSTTWIQDQVKQNIQDRLVNGAKSPGGLIQLQDQWGTLRHANNNAFVAMVYGDFLTVEEPLRTNCIEFAKSQLDYTLGSNPKNRSYLIGYQPDGKTVVGTDPTVVDVHHGTAHGTWKGFEHSITGKPEFQNMRHTLYGAIVGGPDWNDNFWKLDGGAPASPVYESQTEVAIDYNGGLTGLLARMSQSAPGGSVLDGFPAVEARSGPRDEEYFVEALANATGADHVEITARLNNRSRWPAKVRNQMSFRYYYTIDAGTTITPTIVSGTGATISAPTLCGGNTYYVTVSFPSVDIFPAYVWSSTPSAVINGYYKEVVFRLTSSGAWNNADDWSYADFTTQLDQVPPVIATKIPVYDDGVKLYGDAPTTCADPVDFTLAATPTTLTVAQGANGSSALTIGALNGFTGTVDLTTEGLPTGVTAVFTPASVAGSGTSTVTFTADATAAAGTTPVVVRGTSGTLVHEVTISLTITVTATPDFELAINPTATSVAQGGSSTVTVTINSVGGFISPVILTAEELPAGVTASFNPMSVSGNSSSTLTLTADATAAAGVATVTIKGTSGAISHTVTLAVDITTGSTEPDFTLAANPTTLTVAQGANGSSALSIGALNGFTGTVDLTAEGLPAGITAVFTPASVAGSGTSTVTFTADATAAAGTTPVTIRGTSGTLVHEVTITVEITAPTPPSLAVISFTLLDAATNQPIDGFDPLPNNATIELAQLPAANLLIRANTEPATVGSVVLDLNGAATTVESAPYTIAWTPMPGSYTLMATPYSEVGASGITGVALTIGFSVVQGIRPHYVFSPNGDEIDPYWLIDGIEEHPDYQVLIFDRYGNKVFDAMPYVNSWDGTLAGRPLAEGAYFYVIRRDRKQNIKTGSITLLR